MPEADVGISIFMTLLGIMATLFLVDVPPHTGAQALMAACVLTFIWVSAIVMWREVYKTRARK